MLKLGGGVSFVLPVFDCFDSKQKFLNDVCLSSILQRD